MCPLIVPPDGLLSYCPKSFCDEILRLPQLEKWFSIRGECEFPYDFVGLLNKYLLMVIDRVYSVMHFSSNKPHNVKFEMTQAIFIRTFLEI